MHRWHIFPWIFILAVAVAAFMQPGGSCRKPQLCLMVGSGKLHCSELVSCHTPHHTTPPPVQWQYSGTHCSDCKGSRPSLHPLPVSKFGFWRSCVVLGFTLALSPICLWEALFEVFPEIHPFLWARGSLTWYSYNSSQFEFISWGIQDCGNITHLTHLSVYLLCNSIFLQTQLFVFPISVIITILLVLMAVKQFEQGCPVPASSAQEWAGPTFPTSNPPTHQTLPTSNMSQYTPLLPLEKTLCWNLLAGHILQQTIHCAVSRLDHYYSHWKYPRCYM